MPRRPNSSTDEILTITLELIAEHDVSGVTVDMVAEKAGVSKATMYRRWASKEELVIEAVTYLRHPKANPDTGFLRDDLTILLKELVDFLNRPDGGKVFGAFQNAAIRNPKLSALNRRALHEARAPYERAIARAIARGELAANTNVQLMIDVLISPILYRRLIEHTNARQSDIRMILDMAFTAFGR